MPRPSCYMVDPDAHGALPADRDYALVQDLLFDSTLSLDDAYITSLSIHDYASGRRIITGRDPEHFDPLLRKYGSYKIQEWQRFGSIVRIFISVSAPWRKA